MQRLPDCHIRMGTTKFRIGGENPLNRLIRWKNDVVQFLCFILGVLKDFR